MFHNLINLTNLQTPLSYEFLFNLFSYLIIVSLSNYHAARVLVLVRNIGMISFNFKQISTSEFGSVYDILPTFVNTKRNSLQTTVPTSVGGSRNEFLQTLSASHQTPEFSSWLLVTVFFLSVSRFVKFGLKVNQIPPVEMCQLLCLLMLIIRSTTSRNKISLSKLTFKSFALRPINAAFLPLRPSLIKYKLIKKCR